MKNTILKMAGVKDEKSFYKKYPTEAAFLKAHPKAKAELKKFATGGQMNAQAMQQFAGGGFFQDAGEGIGNYFKAVADTTLGTFGATNVIKDSDYSGYGANEMSNLNKTLQPITSAAAPLIAGALGGPAAGMLVSSGQQLIGGFNPEDNTGLDENGNPKNPNAAKYQKAGQTIAQLGSFGAQAYGAFGGSGGAKTGINANNTQSRFLPMSSTDNMGQTQFGVAKYGGMYNMGGIQQYAMGGFGDPTDPPISAKIINNAQKVGTVPSNYNKIGSQDNRTYYDVASDKAKSNPLGNGTGPNPGWEQSIIKRLQSGTSAQSLADAGHISSSQIEKYNQYYKPVYTETEPVKTEPIPLADENKIDRKQVFSGSPYNTFQYPDSTGGYAKATTRYFDPKTNKEIDAFKSFDSEGNYVPFYTNNSSEGIQGTLKQTRINTPINSPVDSIPVNTGNSGFKYGGKMQYAMGGKIQYANGGTGEINAEVEDNENAIGPNGEFTQFSGPTHAEGGIETDMAPGTMIFSDKLKMPGSKKSFAALNKLYDTNKEDNVLSSEKSNNTLRLTAMLMRDAKLKQSLALFQEQEQFKQDKVAAYAKRMGVQIPSQDNEQMPQGMPGQSQGEMAIGKHGGMMNYMAMGGFQGSDYQTDPGKLSSLLRQQKANDATILGMRSSFGRNADTNNVEDPLVVTFNKAKNYGKELEDKIKNHPDNKKIKPFATGGKLPMYEDGGFDWANAGKQAGQYALQNAGNIYDLYRSTQDNSKLNLARYSPDLLDKTQDLANNQRMYSEGKRQTAEASQGNASTYLNNMYANRASKLANDLNVNTTYGNLNAQIANAAKLYNAGVIDKATMFKLQSEGANRDMFASGLKGVSQNIINQINSNKKDDLDQQRLGIQKDFYKEYWANENRKNQEKINKNKEEDED